jgi:hypothetical protein
MLHVETIDLSSRGVTLPGERIGMVIAQPFLSLTDTRPGKGMTHEPQSTASGVSTARSR